MPSHKPSRLTKAKVKQLVLTTTLILVGVLLSLWALVRVVDPGPKGRIVIATGGAGGAYHQYAQQLVKDAARYGIDLRLRPDIEGVSTVGAVLNEASGVQGGIVKGGLAGSLQGRFATDEDRKQRTNQIDGLRSIGRLFNEPIWVFYRGPEHVKALKDFKGRRILIGSQASGTRKIAAQLLRANGIDAGNSQLIERELPNNAGPLLRGEVDVAFVIAPPELERVQRLLRVPDILLMDFSAVADSYANRFPYLSRIVMHEGAVEFAPPLPTADITLLTTQAAFVVRKDTHPAIAAILTNVMQSNPNTGFDKDGEPILFFRSGEFPNGKDPEFGVPPESALAYRSGELPILLRSVAPINTRLGIPFSISAFIYQHGTQMVLLLIPILSILLPLIRFLPMIYAWNIKRRLIFWYEKLKALEASLDRDPSRAHLLEQVRELDLIDGAVRRIRVPSHASDQLYDLRGHIELVRHKLILREGDGELATG